MLLTTQTPKREEIDMILHKRISSAVVIMACMFSLGGASAHAESPNIILILTDDQGWSQLSEPMDSRLPNASSDYLETPNMNRLANGGIRFTSGYSPAAVCTPTRRGILFGTTSVRSGSQFRSRWEPKKHLSLPQALKRANPDYQCSHFGKWGELMGAEPEAVGYDASHGETGNGTGGMPKTLGFKRDAPGAPTYVIDNVDPKRTPTITDDAVEFMKSTLKEDKPFYVQLSYYAVHLSSVLRESTLKKYQQKGEPDRGYSQGWAGMLDDLDHDVGRLLDAVDELGIADNTYIFYLSDNGGRGSTPGGNKKSKATNFPLAGSKHTLYEGGIRVPFLVRGPGVPAGEYCHVPVAGYDLLPTFFDLAGGKKLLSEEIDGVSIKPLLVNPAGGKLSRPDDALYFNFILSKGGMSSIRSGDYKLMLFWDKNDKQESRALYNLNVDPLEQTELSGKEPKRADALQKQLIEYIERVGGEMPTTALPRGPKDYQRYLKTQYQLHPI
jgi:arylsulfatase A